MINLRLDFLHSPWWLLLLIPAAIFTLLPYFRLSKKYRKTRNRITSVVLHSLIMLCCICVLSGMIFRYQKPNNQNEIILLVDVSDTEEKSKTSRDRFVQNVLYDCEGGGFRVGVVTFGFDQEYAVPLTTDLKDVYEQYVEADLPDTSATNIADALEYAKGLFKYPETAKIVVITDGKETDEEATKVIRSVAAQGIRVDTAYVPSAYEGSDVQVSSIDFPDYHVNVDEECVIGVTLNSTSTDPVSIKVTLVDKALYGTSGSITNEQVVDMAEGEKTVFFHHTFATGDLHEMQVLIETDGDLLEENNKFSSYMYLQAFKNILIIEREDGTSQALADMLNEGKPDKDKYAITTMHYKAEELPTTVDGFRAYEQVILNNISNSELKSVINPTTEETLDVVLEEYVKEYGGGLFTVGGMDENGESNVYNQDTMYGSRYQQMLPVESIKYTPPVGIMLIVDVSGSMLSGDVGDRPLDMAILGAIACLDPEVLSERDYVGIMTLDSVYGKILQLTPMTKRDLIKQKIQELEDVKGGGTLFSQAIETAAQELNQENLAKKHIVVITDGGIASSDWEATKNNVDKYQKSHGVTLSVIGIGMQSSGNNAAYANMTELAETYGKGKLYTVKDNDMSGMVLAMREDFRMQPIEAVNDEKPYAPVIAKMTSPLVQGLERGEETDKNRMTVQLDGYFGVKIKEAAELILTAEYGAPVYAQWKYGKGMVGSFMCDLQGVWSADFMSDANGALFIDRVVKNLMPVEALTPSEIRLELSEDNYTNHLRVYTTLQEGEYVKGEVVVLNSENKEEQRISLNEATKGTMQELREMACYVTNPLQASNHYSRADFVIKGAGVYKLEFTKYNAEGVAISKTVEMHKSFAYSEEYQAYEKTEEEIVASLSKLAEGGKGAFVQNLDDTEKIFDGFITAIDKTFDPRYLFIIIAIVLFLLDIAVRKFKFKWPHELIRAYMAKRVEKKKK